MERRLTLDILKNAYFSLAQVSIFAYTNFTMNNRGESVKQSEFLRWLQAQGVVIEQGTKHLKLYHNGQQTILSRHPSKELKQGLVEGVKKRLKLK